MLDQFLATHSLSWIAMMLILFVGLAYCILAIIIDSLNDDNCSTNNNEDNHNA